jgi:hypothetical protein
MLCVAGFGPARADITAVLPAEGGTVGTLMTLMGSGFGDQRGNVRLGTTLCKILSWGDTIVTCEVVTPQPAGDYTVTLVPRSSKEHSKPITGSFTMLAPQITPGDPLRLVTPREQVTIAGAFFGDKKGEVYLRDIPGDTVAAKVQDWSMDAISFEIPEGLTGCLTLGVTNEVGLAIQPFWGTLTPVPPGATPQTNISFNVSSANNASGVYFNGALWTFYGEYESIGLHMHNGIHVMCYTNGALLAAPECGGTTWAVVAPLVIAHELWAFHTGEDSCMYYKRFLTVSNMWENGTGDWNRIGTLTTGDNHLEIAPAYDPIKNRIEVYYSLNHTIYLTVSDDRGANWSSGVPVAGLTGVVVSAPSAAFYQQTATNGVTLLVIGVSEPDGTYLDCFSVRNGAVVKQEMHAPGLYGRPFLADLGEDYFGVIWTTSDATYPLVKKLDKNTGKWLPLTIPFAQSSCWSPNLAVNYEQKPDTTSLSNRWDANVYLFWGYHQKWPENEEIPQMSSIEWLGYWQEITNSPQTTNLGPDTTNFFQLWAVLGVIDAPPFILNGEPYVDEPPIHNQATRVEFGTQQTTFDGSEMKYTIGPYIETGEKSPMKLELTATVGQEVSHEQELTVSFNQTLFRSMAGRVGVYYLAPELEVHQVQWHNLADPTETNDFMYPTLMTGNSQGRWYLFSPTNFPVTGAAGMPATYFDLDSFPLHCNITDDLERLYSYTTPANPCWFENTLDWAAGGEGSIEWTMGSTESTTSSASLEFKVGAMIMKRIGFGVEGSFEVQTTTTTTLTSKSAVFEDNPYSSEIGEIKHFAADCRWLAPDASGYWVPLNRRGYGDAPWFITYGVDRGSIQFNP